MDIATPRVDVTGISIDADKEEIAAVFDETGYSRLPVYKGNDRRYYRYYLPEGLL